MFLNSTDSFIHESELDADETNFGEIPRHGSAMSGNVLTRQQQDYLKQLVKNRHLSNSSSAFNRSVEYEPEEFRQEMKRAEKEEKIEKNDSSLLKNQVWVFLFAVIKTFLVCFT